MLTCVLSNIGVSSCTGVTCCKSRREMKGESKRELERDEELGIELMGESWSGLIDV